MTGAAPQMDADGQAVRLEVPVHFISPARRIWPELAGAGGPPALAAERLAQLARTPVDCWVLRTFYHLRQVSELVSLGTEMRLDRINMACVYDIGRRRRRNLGFLAVAQADGYRSALGNFNIRQNGLEGRDATQDWVPHWRQPAIRPRRAGRGTTIATVAYRGGLVNLAPAFRAPGFAAELDARGLAFDLGEDGAADWADFTEVDVILAVRSATLRDLKAKPASKLVNAWAAGVPVIAGHEPAFEELRRSDLDYIQVATPAEAIAAIDNLRAHPERYAAMVRNGLQRAEAFSDDRLQRRWIALFNGPIARAFAGWQRLPRLLRALRVAGMLAAEKGRLRRYLEDRAHGERLAAA